MAFCREEAMALPVSRENVVRFIAKKKEKKRGRREEGSASVVVHSFVISFCYFF